MSKIGHQLHTRAHTPFVFLIWFVCIRTDPIPYGLRFPEDFVACSLVTQAVMGREDRLAIRMDLYIS